MFYFGLFIFPVIFMHFKNKNVGERKKKKKNKKKKISWGNAITAPPGR